MGALGIKSMEAWMGMSHALFLSPLIVKGVGVKEGKVLRQPHLDPVFHGKKKLTWKFVVIFLSLHRPRLQKSEIGKGIAFEEPSSTFIGRSSFPFHHRQGSMLETVSIVSGEVIVYVPLSIIGKVQCWGRSR